MGKRLAKRGFHPDMIWTSSARRALDTAAILAKQLHYRRRDIQIDERLYATSATALLQLIRGLKRDMKRVLLCGHNPELHSVANSLGAKLAQLPTCALVQLRFDVAEWSAVTAASLTRARFERPKKS